MKDKHYEKFVACCKFDRAVILLVIMAILTIGALYISLILAGIFVFIMAIIATYILHLESKIETLTFDIEFDKLEKLIHDNCNNNNKSTDRSNS